LKRIYSSFNLAAVHHARNLLETEGIRAVVKNEFLSSAMGDLPPAECQAEVWVLFEKDFQAAEAVLRSINSQANLPAWKCACGENCEGQFTQCWRCGAFRES
jgi:Putative prokaryotic signal transducing protein